MKLVNFNINNYVHVKLTNEGLKILRDQHEDMRVTFPLMEKFEPPVVDDEGYSKFQMWSLIRTFGEAMGPCKLLPFDTDIKFEVK